MASLSQLVVDTASFDNSRSRPHKVKVEVTTGSTPAVVPAENEPSQDVGAVAEVSAVEVYGSPFHTINGYRAVGKRAAFEPCSLGLVTRSVYPDDPGRNSGVHGVQWTD